MPETTHEPAVVVRHERLHAFLVDALTAMKMAPAAAETTAALMVQTDLRGVDSHGVGMLPRYHELWQQGFIAMEAEPVVVRDEMATALLDGQKGLGHSVSTLAMRMAIDKARVYGLGAVAVRNSGHYGAAACYSMMALEHDMIGITTTNSPYVAMVPTFGRKAMLSTNPLSFAAPAGRHAPFVLDMATTTVAYGKLSIASRWKKPIPAGWALDDRGLPTTDPFEAIKHRLLTPVGGSRELGSHKGYGLGVMVDILSGVLPGAVYGTLFFRSDMAERRLQDVGHCFMALDPARFRSLDEFKRDMDDMFETLKSSPRAEGQGRIYVAGEPEADCEAERRAHGIPLAPALVAHCDVVAASLRITGLSGRQ
jgi:LDH2 family malate/lactate/ureidoglycolate dehydrogenase